MTQQNDSISAIVSGVQNDPLEYREKILELLFIFMFVKD